MARGAEYLSRRPWRDIRAPDAVLAVPTMLSAEEQTLLFTLARDFATGVGAIVDAGCFLGGSSAALLAGVAERESPWQGPPVVSYDRFLVEEYTLETYFSEDPNVTVGDSFRALYDQNVAPFDAPHEVREGDLVEIGWSGEPIEILFIDVLKNWDLNSAVLRDFMPCVIPGQTVMVHQDYAWGQLPWIHMTVELMWESLTWLDALPWGSHVFLVNQPIPDEVIGMDIRRDLTDSDKIALIDRAIARDAAGSGEMLTLSKAALLSELGDTEAARHLVQTVERRTTDDSVRLCIRHGHSELSAGL